MLDQMLNTLCERLKAEEDTVVFLGDYIDRGENSREVLATLIKFRNEYPNAVFLRGNHEQLILDAKDGPPVEMADNGGFAIFSDMMVNWLQNGGMDTLVNYECKDVVKWCDYIPLEHWAFMRETEIEYLADGYHFVHAGLLPRGKSWEGETWGYKVDPRLWIREPFLSSKELFDGRVVVFGHTPQRNGKPLMSKNKIGLDTAAVFGGPLTAAVFQPFKSGSRMPTPEFIQIPYYRPAAEPVYAV